VSESHIDRAMPDLCSITVYADDRLLFSGYLMRPQTINDRIAEAIGALNEGRWTLVSATITPGPPVLR
jgi:hypothetical protein